jgi:hypothetical protein
MQPEVATLLSNWMDNPAFCSVYFMFVKSVYFKFSGLLSHVDLYINYNISSFHVGLEEPGNEKALWALQTWEKTLSVDTAYISQKICIVSSATVKIWNIAQHTTLTTDTSMISVGFEPTISAGERTQTYALDRAVTGTGKHNILCSFYYFWQTIRTLQLDQVYYYFFILLFLFWRRCDACVTV